MPPLPFFVSLITTFFLSYALFMSAYFLITSWKRASDFLEKKSHAMSILISNLCALITVLSTLSLHYILSLFDNPSVVLICSSGLHIPIIMAVLNMLYHLTFAAYSKKNGFLLFSQLTASYVVFCILAVLLSAFYLHDPALSAVFLAILLGRVIWFDTDLSAIWLSIRCVFTSIFNFSFEKFSRVMHSLFKKYLGIVITCLIYIVVMIVIETFDNLLPLLGAFDIGMGAAGVTILFLEHKKHSKSIQEKEDCH